MPRVGIIGCGAIARKRQAPAVAKYPGVELAGFADVNKSMAEKMAEQYGAHSYRGMEDMLADPTVDAVCVCVPERFHVDVTIRCLEAGKDVLLEKPMAMNAEESQRIVEAWEKSQRRLMIAYSQRFYREHILAKELIQRGEIGRVFSFRTNLSNPGVEKAVYNSQSDFYDRRLESIGGVMSNVGCHRIDLIRYLFDAEIEELFACTPALDKRFSDGRLIDHEDHAMVTMKLSNGIYGTLWSSWCNYGAYEQGTVIFGDRGAIHTYEGGGVQVQRSDGGVLTYAVKHTPEDTNGWGVVDSFLDSLAKGGDTATNGYDGLACMRVLDAIERSAKERRWLSVSEK